MGVAFAFAEIIRVAPFPSKALPPSSESKVKVLMKTSARAVVSDEEEEEDED